MALFAGGGFCRRGTAIGGEAAHDILPSMWRAVRGDRIVYDEFWPGLWLVALVCWPIVGVACIDPYRIDLLQFVVSVAGAVAGVALRRRCELDRASRSVRVAWVLAATPGLPAITLRGIVDRSASVVAEVIVDLPIVSRYGTRYPIELLYSQPLRRPGGDVDRTRVAAFGSFAKALELARSLAADLGVTARDVRSETDAPAITLGM
ncbi:hypothetical protein [Nannocystis pusilla]|uniref:Uncharacterized protein n=1 Tax=Nannocystis pusilla TaxID=889268 RepID=A0ABS7TR98_9BACT|nr:hypothetical protein [Nannocystis pusilla]MBZ5710657.1 hypothetical protein [Nannocystis pusilla]